MLNICIDWNLHLFIVSFILDKNFFEHESDFFMIILLYYGVHCDIYKSSYNIS
jgi:hypothetical protein